MWSLGKLVSFIFHPGKHQENKTNCFPRDHTLSVYYFIFKDPIVLIVRKVYVYYFIFKDPIVLIKVIKNKTLIFIHRKDKVNSS